MAGERGLHRDLRGLEVADLAHHHDVGVLAQDGAQPAREAHVDARVDLRLADAVDVVLDRVLDGHDVARGVVEAAERGVERRGLARAGRAGDEEDAVRFVDQAVEQGGGTAVHAELAEVEPPRLLVEQAQHHAFAVAGRDGRDAHIDRAARDAQTDAPVLRQPLLGDVELGHHLDARDDRRRHRAPRLQRLAQHAVDAQPHHEPVLERLDVDVRGVLLDRLGQQRVDELDDRRIVLALEQVGLLGQVLREMREVDLLLDAARRAAGIDAGFIGLLQQPVEGLGGHALEAHRSAEVAPRFGDGGGAGAFAHREPRGIAVEALQQHALAAGEGERQSGRPRGGAARAHGLGSAGGVVGAGGATGVVCGAGTAGSGKGGSSARCSPGSSGSTSRCGPRRRCWSRM